MHLLLVGLIRIDLPGHRRSGHRRNLLRLVPRICLRSLGHDHLVGSHHMYNHHRVFQTFDLCLDHPSLVQLVRRDEVDAVLLL